MKYNTIDEYIDNQDINKAELLIQLKHFINKTFSFLEEKISYNVPFYNHFGQLFYLSPFKGGIYFGFIRGYLITDFAEVLVAENRKQVKVYRIYFQESVDYDTIEEIILKAIQINELRNSYRNDQ